MQAPRRSVPPRRAADPLPAWTVRRRPQPRTSGAAPAAGVFAAVAVAALVALHALTLATAPGAAQRTLVAVLPALTDFDQALVAHAEGLSATAAGSIESVPVPGLPFTVQVPVAAAAAGGAELRHAALDALVQRVYREGADAFRAPDAAGSPSLLSSGWMLQRALAQLTHPTHERYERWRTIAAAIAAVALGVLFLQVDAWRRAVVLGAAVLAGAVIAALATLAARGIVWLFVSGDSSIAGAVTERVAYDTSMTVLVVAAFTAVAGIVLVVAGGVLSRVFGQAPPRRPVGYYARMDETWEEF